jgi:hypothetical protein
MRVRNNILLCSAIITALAVASGHADESRLRIMVSPLVSTAPGVVTIRAIVKPDAANRELQIVADSESYYRSSIVPLDGANAAAVTETRLKNLPGGEYSVTVVLVEANGERISDRRQITVMSTPAL